MKRIAFAMVAVVAACDGATSKPPVTAPPVPEPAPSVSETRPRPAPPVEKPMRMTLAERGADVGWATMLMARGRVYWLTELRKWTGPMYVPASILWSVSDDGGAPVRHMEIEGVATLAADDESLYVAVYRNLSMMNTTRADVPTGRIFRMPLGGGAAVDLANNVAPHAIGVDEQTLYFDGSRMPKDGSKPPTASGAKDALRFAFDEGNVYFAVARGNGRAAGQVLRMPKRGGAPSVLANGLPDEPLGLAVDRTHVYFTATWVGAKAEKGGVVGRVSKEGGAAEMLATEQPNVHDVWITDEHAYFFSGRRGFPGNVLRVAKSGGAVEPVTSDSTLEQVAFGPSAIYLASDGTFDDTTKQRLSPAVLLRVAR